MDSIIGGAAVIALAIIIGSIIIARTIEHKEVTEIGIYQAVKLNESEIILINTRTGQYWIKPIVLNSSVKSENHVLNKRA